ncbi:nuclear transport factor 2 family protein [Tenggerimyces flavus]|uniref:Nuclear transport factor 2 family protein n=1 Tax=Tenggerimyces flavus TaxID=1708749 RepID=A0ABV7YCR6_9ACTN|nr:nuclear transport factor 2 family protein [Tenggerimyces flavus]MBM7788123.1 ketosteroid isomerase-like protein [Tenggerimyces flavus]
MTPRETVERMLQASVDNAWDEFADLYAEDVVIEIPFTPNGQTARAVGREGLRERVKSFGTMRELTKVDNVVLHETVDPEVVIVEYDLHGQFRDQKPFVLSYVMVVRVRDGLIVSSRDYGNPVMTSRAMGMDVDQFAALLEQAAR